MRTPLRKVLRKIEQQKQRRRMNLIRFYRRKRNSAKRPHRWLVEFWWT